MGGVARPTDRQRGDHRDERATERRGHGRGAAATGDGLGRGEARDEVIEGAVAEAARSIGGLHAGLYGGGSAGLAGMATHHVDDELGHGVGVIPDRATRGSRTTRQASSAADRSAAGDIDGSACRRPKNSTASSVQSTA